MKLLISAYACDPTRGGEHSGGWNVAYYNAQRGHQVWCITNIDGKDNVEAYLHQHPIDNLHVIHLALPAWLETWFVKQPEIGVYPHYLYWQYRVYQLAKRLNEVIDFDLMHHLTYGSLSLGSHLWKLDKPLLYGPAGGGQSAPAAFKHYFMHGWRQEQLRGFIRFLLLDVFKTSANTIRHADRMLVVNQETYDAAQHYGARSLAFQPDLSLEDDFYPDVDVDQKEADRLRLLWVGRILPRKGLRLSLEAVARVRHKIPVSLTIIGYGSMDVYVNDWIRELDLAGVVRWVGRQPFEEVQRAYAQHEVLLFPSLRESFGNQIVEAMAYGLPPILLDHNGGAVFVPDDAGIKIPVTTPEEVVQAIAACLVDLYQHPDKRKAMGKRAQECAKTFTVSAHVDAINRHYREVLDQPVLA